MAGNWRILVITPPFWGHFNPTLEVGKELIKSENEVTWVSMFPEAQQTIPEGGKFILIPGIQSYSSSFNEKGMRSLVDLYEEKLLPINRELYKGISEVINVKDYDLIITDNQAPAGAVLAYENNVPFVTSVTSPAAIDRSDNFPGVQDFEDEKFIEFQQEMGINVDHVLTCSSPLTLIYSSTQFLGRNSFPDSFKFIGLSIDYNREEHQQYQNKEFAIEMVEYMLSLNRPLVLVTLGSILNGEAVFVDKVVEAFEHEDISVLMVTDYGIRDKWPENFVVLHHIPQLWVLNKVDAVVCHAGYNTVCETLNAGVPLVVIPSVNDQSYVADKVEKNLSGIRLKYKRLSAKKLKDATLEVLTNTSYRSAALATKASFAKAGGAVKASNLINDFLNQEALV